MAKKKFVTLSQNKKNYRLFLDDIKAAHKKIKRNIPNIPRFSLHETLAEEDDESLDVRCQPLKT